MLLFSLVNKGFEYDDAAISRASGATSVRLPLEVVGNGKNGTVTGGIADTKAALPPKVGPIEIVSRQIAVHYGALLNFKVKNVNYTR